jgi:glycosyltransferase involved in cell wall biosynthesis
MRAKLKATLDFSPALALVQPMSQTPEPISCYIRTQNEERMIARVISAAKQVAAEIVIVDSGSTDRTIEIAEGLGAKVVRQPWLGGGKQKRVGEEHCTHNWMLDLDADEVLTPALINEIQGVMERGPECPVYEVSLPTAPPYGEPWWDFGIVYRNRLYDRRMIQATDHAGWDQLEIPPGMKVGKLIAPLLHYSFRDIAHMEEKQNRVSTSRAKNSKLKPMWQLTLRIVFGRPFYFFKSYFMRGFWRGGLYGFALASVLAHGRWLRDVKMLEIHLARKRDAEGGA